MSDYTIELGMPCPHCGNEVTHYRECGHCENGLVDGADEDPMWFDVGDSYKCPDCAGQFIFRWCSVCGNDPRIPVLDLAQYPFAIKVLQAIEDMGGVVTLVPIMELANLEGGPLSERLKEVQTIRDYRMIEEDLELLELTITDYGRKILMESKK